MPLEQVQQLSRLETQEWLHHFLEEDRKNELERQRAKAGRAKKGGGRSFGKRAR